MFEWLSQSWWQVVWIPLLGLGVTFFAGTWKIQTESRNQRDARLENRQEDWIKTQKVEIEDLKKELEREKNWSLQCRRDMEGQAREYQRALEERDDEIQKWRWISNHWLGVARNFNHALFSARWMARIEREAAGKPIPETWPTELVDLPPMEDPWNSRPRPLPDVVAGQPRLK